MVKSLTKDGTTICATIHSPTAYCFSLFDRLIMLVRGRVVYFGAVGESLWHWTSSLCRCPLLHHAALQLCIHVCTSLDLDLAPPMPCRGGTNTAEGRKHTGSRATFVALHSSLGQGRRLAHVPIERG